MKKKEWDAYQQKSIFKKNPFSVDKDLSIKKQNCITFRRQYRRITLALE